MKQITDTIPKCLVELSGIPLLEWQITSLRNAGITEIGLVSGYKREMLEKYHLVEFHNAQWEYTNMVSSLECAALWLSSSSCIVSYSDIFYESHAVDSLCNCGKKIAITYDPNWKTLWERRFEDPLIDAETFQLNSDGTVYEIGNKPNSLSDIQGQYMGLLLITPEGWNEITEIRSSLSASERNKMDMTGLLQRVIKLNRIPVHAIKYQGKWGEIDSSKDLKLYQDWI